MAGPLFAFCYYEPLDKDCMRALSAVVTLAISSFAVSGPTPLRVLRVTPTDAAAATAVVTVTFDRPVAGSLDATVDPQRIFAIAPAVAGRVEWRDPITLRFTPAAPLSPATAYTVTVSNEFAAMDGGRLAQPYSFTFRVHGTVPLAGAPTGPNEVGQFLKPDAQIARCCSCACGPSRSARSAPTTRGAIARPVAGSATGAGMRSGAS